MKELLSRRALVAGFVVLALPLTLAACGDDSGSGNEPAAQETEGEESAETPGEASQPATVEVVATDYHFEAPTTVAAGDVTFALSNQGKEPHELQLAKIVTDLSLEEIVQLPEKKALSNIEQVGFTFAKPGEDAEKPLEATLEPGRYGMVCFVPVKGDGPPHAFEGMVHEFTVE